MKIAAIVVAAFLVLGGGAFLIGSGFGGKSGDVAGVADTSVSNVSIEDGKQIIEITAKGGYQPRESVAKTGIPTILRFKTAGTFDCSSSVRIASLGIDKILPSSGSTDIDIGSAQAGVLQGSCGMGMYPFVVQFKG